MRGNIDPQQTIKLLRKNNSKIKDTRRNPYLLNLIQDYQFLPSNIRDLMSRSHSLKDSSQQRSKYKILTDIHQKFSNMFHHHIIMKACCFQDQVLQHA